MKGDSGSMLGGVYITDVPVINGEGPRVPPPLWPFIWLDPNLPIWFETIGMADGMQLTQSKKVKEVLSFMPQRLEMLQDFGQVKPVLLREFDD